MSSGAELHVLYTMANAPVREYPYPHLFVREVFPPDYYGELLHNLPPEGELRTLGELGRSVGTDYPARRVMPLTRENVARLGERQRAFWEQLAQWLLGPGFGQLVIAKFAPWLAHRFGDLRTVQFRDEALIVRDRTNYSLGPHTDAPSKVVSLLFYLPPDEARPGLGTSIYVPRDPGFQCPGGPHHDFARFRRMQTMPYVPNSLFAFMKTPNAFHGVEPIEEPDVRRDLLLYDIRVDTPQQKAAGAPSVTFSF